MLTPEDVKYEGSIWGKNESYELKLASLGSEAVPPYAEDELNLFKWGNESCTFIVSPCGANSRSCIGFLCATSQIYSNRGTNLVHS
jgi:hypothetical protein